MEIRFLTTVQAPDLDGLANLIERLEALDHLICQFRDSHPGAFRPASNVVNEIILDLTTIQDETQFGGMTIGPPRVGRPRTSKGYTMFLEDPRKIISFVMGSIEVTLKSTKIPKGKDDLKQICKTFKQLRSDLKGSMRKFNEILVELPRPSGRY